MIKLNSENISQKQSITVKFFYDNTKELLHLHEYKSNTGMEREIKDQNLHRPGLALAGFVDLFSHKRIQVFGNTEIRYLNQLSKEERIEKLEKIYDLEIPCVILTDGNKPPEDFVEVAEHNNRAMFISEFSSTKLMYLLSDFLDDQFAPRMSVHASLVDVYGVGMMFIGKSGVGKSEVALDLVERGHRLVADDVVILTKKGESLLIASGTELAQHFMEIRGIGILDVRSMFGIRAIRFQKRLEVVIELEVWDGAREYTRTGLDDKYIQYLGIDILHVRLPIVPGKNITVISEVIALKYLLKHYGYDAAKVMSERLSNKIKMKTSQLNRSVDYFEHDFE